MSDGVRIDHALLNLRSAIENAGGQATGVRIVVSHDNMEVFMNKLGGLMSPVRTDDHVVYHSLGFEFQEK